MGCKGPCKRGAALKSDVDRVQGYALQHAGIKISHDGKTSRTVLQVVKCLLVGPGRIGMINPLQNVPWSVFHTIRPWSHHLLVKRF